MAARIMYQLVGRYMDGKEVTGYHLQSLDRGKSGRYTREQVVYLVGRGQVTNCTGQVYKDTVLLRGKGINIENLPIVREDGTITNAESLGRIRRGTEGGAALEQINIVGTIRSGRKTIGYVVQNAGGGRSNVKREALIKLATSGVVGNARVQAYKNQPLLRGVGVNLDELPVIQVGENTK